MQPMQTCLPLVHQKARSTYFGVDRKGVKTEVTMKKEKHDKIFSGHISSIKSIVFHTQYTSIQRFLLCVQRIRTFLHAKLNNQQQHKNKE